MYLRPLLLLLWQPWLVTENRNRRRPQAGQQKRLPATRSCIRQWKRRQPRQNLQLPCRRLCQPNSRSRKRNRPRRITFLRRTNFLRQMKRKWLKKWRHRRRQAKRQKVLLACVDLASVVEVDLQDMG